MKRRLLFLVTFLVAHSYAQTECLLDEVKFSGNATVTEVGGTKIKASDATANHRFGERVAIDGNIAVATSRSNGGAAGKVYIFINDGSGNWSQQTIITASDGFAGDNFGSSVALEGNHLLVGARSQTNTSGVDTGAAYLFEYDGSSTWKEVTIFEPSDGSSDDRFGESVSIEGDLILVGARNGCTGGCAYLYENDGTNTFTFTETKLEPQVQSNYSGAKFGYDVLVKDGRAYVGGPQDYSVVGNASAGSVQIWDQENDGSWSRTHRLRGTETTEFFGSAISVQGDYLAIGALNFETSSTSGADQGRVYVYKADVNGNYSDATRVMIQNNDKDSYTDQRFGSAVALENEYVFVGARGVSGSVNSDALYIFKDDGSNNWTEISKITTGDAVGYFSNNALSISYPNMIIGQNRDHFPSNSGAVHFVPLASTITPTASVTEVTEAFIGQNNATITLNFSDEATRTEIQFSIDGGTTFPYAFNDDALTGAITNLGVGSYDLQARYNSGSCILDLGTITVNQAAYTAIPDANFEAALERLGYDDITGDGQVPTPLIEVVTELQLAGQNITDLTGIEDFTALEELKANGNNLTNVDLSNNTALKLFWATSGATVNSINVSNNPLLEDLRIIYTGTSIDISSCTALDRFQCANSNLTNLDTSGNPNLTWLDLENTPVNGLDLSTNLNIEILEIDSTSLVNLDLSNNTVLRFLYADNITTLTGLNIQNGTNTNMVTFEIVGTPVPCVLVDDTTYSTTNWTDVDVATTFRDTGYCIYTQIPDANFEAELEALGYDDISGDGQVPTNLIEVVTSLNVNNKNISDVTGIEDFRDLITLECESNNLTSLNISNNLSLETLNALNNQIASIDISQNTALKTINIGNNPVTSLDVSNNNLITRLECDGTNITSLDISNLTQLDYLEAHNTGISALDVSQNAVLRFANLGNTNLTVLDVSANIKLENLRLNNTLLTSLDLSTNTQLKSLRTWETNITELDLSNNIALAGFFGHNGALEILNLKNGNNAAIPNGGFSASGNPNLTCVLVDDATYSSST